MSVRVALGHGEFCFIDEIDIDLIVFHSWSLNRVTGYAQATINKKLEKLHKLIAKRMGIQGQVDHKDRNKRNHSRSNLRAATNSQNSINCETRKSNTSGHRGVYWSHENQNWFSRIKVRGTIIHLGCFQDFDLAVKARVTAEKQYFGEFAHESTS